MRTTAIVALAGLALGAGRDLLADAGNELTLDLGGKVAMKLVRIPAGKFVMGSFETEKWHEHKEAPRHEVTITRDFHMGRCEVTRGQFAAFVKDTQYKTQAEREGWTFAWDGKKWDKIKGASWRKVGFDQTDDHPVICVSFGDAVAFCKWLGAKTGRSVRLPTEAEWEYACRAGSEEAYSWGGEREAGKGRCNAADLTGKKKFRRWHTFRWEDGYVFTAPVGRYKPNAFGLHDMHGNVWEWCGDWFAGNYAQAGKVDPKGPAAGKQRVVRGGSWLSSPNRVRCAFRGKCGEMGFYCDYIIGFRVVVDLPAAGAKRSQPPSKPVSHAAFSGGARPARSAAASEGSPAPAPVGRWRAT